VLLAVWSGNALLILWRHRRDLRHPPAWRGRSQTHRSNEPKGDGP
jgi:hypothetical protein